ncbi:hypothetical protein GAY28_23195 [Azospirillum brasilense]|nr:hypothetical protein [Azospirillum brasilense]
MSCACAGTDAATPVNSRPPSTTFLISPSAFDGDVAMTANDDSLSAPRRLRRGRVGPLRERAPSDAATVPVFYYTAN